MVDTMINIVKNAAEEVDGTLTFTLHTGKMNKKKEEHNRCMMSVMELLDGTDFSFTCTGTTKTTAMISIDHEATLYIYNRMMEIKQEIEQGG